MVWSEQKVLHAKKGERGEETEQEVRWTARHDMRSEGGKVDCAANSALKIEYFGLIYVWLRESASKIQEITQPFECPLLLAAYRHTSALRTVKVEVQRIAGLCK